MTKYNDDQAITNAHKISREIKLTIYIVKTYSLLIMKVYSFL